MDTVSLNICDFDKTAKTLRLRADAFAGRFPQKFEVVSHHTGAKVVFQHIGPDHPLFDEDHWDGEMAIYEPVSPTPGVAVLVLTPY